MQEPDPSKSTRKTFFAELKERNVRKTLAIYLSAALTTVGMANVFSARYQLPAGLFDVILVFIIFGFFSAGIHAWFKGGEQEKGGRKKELLLHGGVFAVASITAFLFATTPRSAILPINAKTLAVLPFSIQSDNKEDEYFGDGIMEDILTNLSKINDLRVISRTSVMRYKEEYREKTKSLRDIGKELNVGTILEGSVQRFGNQVKISSRLVNAQTDENIWGEVYNREMSNIFEIQADVARSIAAALHATLSPDEDRLIDQKPTENLDAYAYYLRGRDLYYRYTKEDNEHAIEMFRKAIEIDPHYALAFAGIADAYGQRVQRFQYGPEWADSAMALSRKAIALNPDIAEPYKSLGLALMQRNWYRQAIDQYENAIRVNPNYSTAVSNLGLAYLWLGFPEKALPLLRRATLLSPERTSNYYHLGIVFEALAADSLTGHYLRIALGLQPDYVPAQIVLAENHVQAGRIDSGRAILERGLDQNPDDLNLLVTLAEIEMTANNLDKAEEHLRKVADVLPFENGPTTQLGYVLTKKGAEKEAKRMLANSLNSNMAGIAEGSESYDAPMELARAYSVLGDTTQALSWLRRAIAGGWILYRDIETEPFLETIKGTPEFRGMVDSLKVRVSQTRRDLEAEGMLY